MFFDGVFKALEFIVWCIAAVAMTMVMIGVLYANRRTLPLVCAFFGVLVAFGLLWPV